MSVKLVMISGSMGIFERAQLIDSLYFPFAEK